MADASYDADVQDSRSSSSISFTALSVASNDDRCLIALLIASENTPPTIDSVSRDSQNFSLNGSGNTGVWDDGDDFAAEVWYLLNPNTGSNAPSVTTTPSGSSLDHFTGWVISLYNVDQVSPIKTELYSFHNGTISPSDDIVSQNGNMCVSAIFADDTTPNWSVGSGQTDMGLANAGKGDSRASYEASTGSPTTMNYTSGAHTADSVHLGASVNKPSDAKKHRPVMMDAIVGIAIINGIVHHFGGQTFASETPAREVSLPKPPKIHFPDRRIFVPSRAQTRALAGA